MCVCVCACMYVYVCGISCALLGRKIGNILSEFICCEIPLLDYVTPIFFELELAQTILYFIADKLSDEKICSLFHKSSYERFSPYEFIEPVLYYGCNESVALTNL